MACFAHSSLLPYSPVDKKQKNKNQKKKETMLTTLSPCQGRLLLAKYINTYPSDSMSSRRLLWRENS